MEQKTGFFEESPGKQSWMRLAGSVLIATAVFIVVWHTLNGTQVPLDTTIMLIGSGIGGKLVQKVQEPK